MRQRFEENRNIKDMRVAKQLLEDGEQELFNKQHYQPKKCEYSDKKVYKVFFSYVIAWKPFFKSPRSLSSHMQREFHKLMCGALREAGNSHWEVCEFYKF
jgi:hypothetical protein